jgi:hypothetical protein
MRWDDETHGTTDANESFVIRKHLDYWCVFRNEVFEAGFFPSVEQARQWVEVRDAVTRPATREVTAPSGALVGARLSDHGAFVGAHIPDRGASESCIHDVAGDPRVEAIAIALYEQEVALLTKVARMISQATGFIVSCDHPHWKKTNKGAKVPHRRTAAKLVAALDGTS